MKTLYFECSSGISGDMTVASLLDLGVSGEALQQGLASLKLDGYTVQVSRTQKCGISATRFDVHIEDEAQEDAAHSHTHEHDQSFSI